MQWHHRSQMIYQYMQWLIVGRLWTLISVLSASSMHLQSYLLVYPLLKPLPSTLVAFYVTLTMIFVTRTMLKLPKVTFIYLYINSIRSPLLIYIYIYTYYFWVWWQEKKNILLWIHLQKLWYCMHFVWLVVLLWSVGFL